MSKRRNTKNRLMLVRSCHTCGRSFSVTADSPFMRQMPNVDGKKQKTCYFCTEKCFAASYKHIGWFDGLAWKRRQEKEAARDTAEKNRRYDAAHAERERARARARYWADPESARKNSAYQRRKRKLMGVNT